MNTIDNQWITDNFSGLTTPIIADAIVRLGLEPRAAAAGIKALMPGTRLAGRTLPVRHFGSVDVFFEAMTSARPGDIMIIDNDGRADEGCIGDLTAHEARAFGVAGMIVWGCHRDTKELIEMDFPVFSYGQTPFGPLRVDERKTPAITTIQFGAVQVEFGDVVFADDDGVIFAPGQELGRLFTVAHEIKETERRQAEAIASGQTLHKQLQFDAYLHKREKDPAYTFRKHLREIGGAIEE